MSEQAVQPFANRPEAAVVVVIAGLLALSGTIGSGLVLLIQLDLLLQSFRHGAYAVGDQYIWLIVGWAVGAAAILILGIQNLFIAARSTAFLAGRWKRYLSNSVLSLALYGAMVLVSRFY